MNRPEQNDDGKELNEQANWSYVFCISFMQKWIPLLKTWKGRIGQDTGWTERRTKC